MPKSPDLTGQKFGKLTAIAPTGKRSYNGEFWICACSCGKVTEIQSHDLRYGRVKSCGCGKNAEGDYTGVRRGDLIGVRKTGKTTMYRGHEVSVWEWRCKCGNVIEKALFEVYPRGASCCPQCALEKKRIQCRKNMSKNRIEGTNMNETQLRNLMEGKLTKKNRSGVRGVSWAKNANKWTARGFKDGKPVHLGYFEHIEDAAKARQEFLNLNINLPEDFELTVPTAKKTEPENEALHSESTGIIP